MNFGPEMSAYKGQSIGYFGTKALPFHMGHVAMVLAAAQKVDVLFVVIGYDDEWDKKLCEGTKFEWVDHTVRERWVTQSLKDIPNVRVLSNYERRSDNYLTDPAVIEANKELERKIENTIDVAFSSELHYEEYFNYALPNAEHIVLDPKRNIVPISATEIREKGIHDSWNYLPRPVQSHYVKRIALCGVESVGKSTFTKILAAHYNTIFVEEYGSTYYEEMGGYHDIDLPSDFLEIIAGHVHLINKALPMANKVLFVDTDAIYTEYFLEGKYFQSDVHLEPFILQNMEKIDLRIYIPPVNKHHLEEKRRPVTEVERQKNHENLIGRYRKYATLLNTPLIELEPGDRTSRFDQLQYHIDKFLSEV